MIDEIGDLKNTNEVVEYNIVLCDIMGVGRYFDTSIQGASIISEIKNTYPAKVVIAYTGAMLNQAAAKQANKRADAILKKDADIEEWIELLDKYIDQVLNPYIVWNKIRYRLFELDVDTKSILEFEDGFVRSILNSDAKMNAYVESVNSSMIGKDVKSILLGVMSTALAKGIGL